MMKHLTVIITFFIGVVYSFPTTLLVNAKPGTIIWEIQNVINSGCGYTNLSDVFRTDLQSFLYKECAKDFAEVSNKTNTIDELIPYELDTLACLAILKYTQMVCAYRDIPKGFEISIPQDSAELIKMTGVEPKAEDAVNDLLCQDLSARSKFPVTSTENNGWPYLNETVAVYSKEDMCKKVCFTANKTELNLLCSIIYGEGKFLSQMYNLSTISSNKGSDVKEKDQNTVQENGASQGSSVASSFSETKVHSEDDLGKHGLSPGQGSSPLPPDGANLGLEHYQKEDSTISRDVGVEVKQTPVDSANDNKIVSPSLNHVEESHKEVSAPVAHSSESNNNQSINSSVNKAKAIGELIANGELIASPINKETTEVTVTEDKLQANTDAEVAPKKDTVPKQVVNGNKGSEDDHEESSDLNRPVETSHVDVASSSSTSPAQGPVPVAPETVSEKQMPKVTDETAGGQQEGYMPKPQLPSRTQPIEELSGGNNVAEDYDNVDGMDDKPDKTINEVLEGDSSDGDYITDASPEYDDSYYAMLNPKMPSEEEDRNHPYVGVVMTDDGDAHFFSYFFTIIMICIIGYLVFHNKQKIIALVIEGRHAKGSSRRRPSTSGYRKLDSNLEEAVTSSRGASVTHVIY